MAHRRQVTFVTIHNADTSLLDNFTGKLCCGSDCDHWSLSFFQQYPHLVHATLWHKCSPEVRLRYRHDQQKLQDANPDPDSLTWQSRQELKAELRASDMWGGLEKAMQHALRKYNYKAAGQGNSGVPKAPSTGQAASGQTPGVGPSAVAAAETAPGPSTSQTAAPTSAGVARPVAAAPAVLRSISACQSYSGASQLGAAAAAAAATATAGVTQTANGRAATTTAAAAPAAAHPSQPYKRIKYTPEQIAFERDVDLDDYEVVC